MEPARGPRRSSPSPWFPLCPRLLLPVSRRALPQWGGPLHPDDRARILAESGRGLPAEAEQLVRRSCSHRSHRGHRLRGLGRPVDPGSHQVAPGLGPSVPRARPAAGPHPGGRASFPPASAAPPYGRKKEKRLSKQAGPDGTSPTRAQGRWPTSGGADSFAPGRRERTIQRAGSELRGLGRAATREVMHLEPLRLPG